MKLTRPHCVCRYRVWRTMYDSISVQNDSKEAFRRLWQSSSLYDTIGGVDGGDASEQIPEGSPLDLAESNSNSGTVYDRMVARAQTKACGFMLACFESGAKTEPHSHFPDHSESCNCFQCRDAVSLFEYRLRYSNTLGPAQKNAEQPPAQGTSTPSDATASSTDTAPAPHESECITPFELALIMLYVHSVDKADQKSLSSGLACEEASKRFIAALEVVETIMKLDDERAHRQGKKPIKHADVAEKNNKNVASMPIRCEGGNPTQTGGNPTQTNIDASNTSSQSVRRASTAPLNRRNSTARRGSTFALSGRKRSVVVRDEDEKIGQSIDKEEDEDYSKKIDDEIEQLRLQQCNKASRECVSVSEVHRKYYSSSIIKGAVACSVFCAIIVFVSLWMATSPSIELSVWQSSLHDSFTDPKGHGSNVYDFDDMDSCLRWLSSNVTAPYPENAFTRQLGSAQLRVVRVNSQTQTCQGSDGLTCIPTLDLSSKLAGGNMLSDDMYSSEPLTFSVPGHALSFTYSQTAAPLKCGKLYCFNGRGYTFQANTPAALAAATRSRIFDANVRALILTFALYSPSLRSLYKGERRPAFIVE